MLCLAWFMVTSIGFINHCLCSLVYESIIVRCYEGYKPVEMVEIYPLDASLSCMLPCTIYSGKG